jgi:hypothetical protein
VFLELEKKISKNDIMEKRWLSSTTTTATFSILFIKEIRIKESFIFFLSFHRPLLGL